MSEPSLATPAGIRQAYPLFRRERHEVGQRRAKGANVPTHRSRSDYPGHEPARHFSRQARAFPIYFRARAFPGSGSSRLGSCPGVGPMRAWLFQIGRAEDPRCGCGAGWAVLLKGSEQVLIYQKKKTDWSPPTTQHRPIDRTHHPLFHPTYKHSTDLPGVDPLPHQTISTVYVNRVLRPAPGDTWMVQFQRAFNQAGADCLPLNDRIDISEIHLSERPIPLSLYLYYPQDCLN